MLILLDFEYFWTMRFGVLFSILFSLTSLQAQKSLTTEQLEASLSTRKDTARVNALNELARRNVRSDSVKAFRFAQEALELSQKIGYYEGTAQAHRRFAMVYYFSNDFDKFLRSIEQSTEIATTHELWSIAAENNGNIAGSYATLGNHTKSLTYYLKAYDLYEKYIPNGAKYIPIMGIAASYRNQSQYDKALEYIERAMPLIDAAGDETNKAIAWENSGQIYLLINNMPKAKECFTNSLALFEKLNGLGGQIHSLTGLANVARDQGDYNSALTYGKRALEISEKFKNSEWPRLYGLESIGKTLLAQNKLVEAKSYLEEGLVIAKRIKLQESVRDLSGDLAQVAAAQQDYKKAYEYEVTFKANADSLLNKEMANQLSEIRTRFETEKREAEIEILKRDNQITQFYFVTAMASMLGVIAFGYLIITRQRLKSKKDRELAIIQNQALVDKKALVEAELKNRELEETKLRDQLDFKNKELTTYTLNLIQKNESLENIKQQVDEMRLLPDQQLRPKLASLINTVNYSLNLDRDWENFKMHFEKVHQGFFDKLLQEYPDLTGNDLKLCALMKLNMETKEIATIIDISPESVKVARHRLRKKMNLATEQNLSSYLAGFK